MCCLVTRYSLLVSRMYLNVYVYVYLCMNGCVGVRYVQLHVQWSFVVQPRHRQLGRFERHLYAVSYTHAHLVEQHPYNDPCDEHYDQHHLRKYQYERVCVAARMSPSAGTAVVVSAYAMLPSNQPPVPPPRLMLSPRWVSVPRLAVTAVADAER